MNRVENGRSSWEGLAGLAKIEEVQRVNDFLKEAKVAISSSPFHPIVELLRRDWDAVIDGRTLTLRENIPDPNVSRIIQFEVDKPENGFPTKATVTREAEGNPIYTVDGIHSIRSEGGFLITIWGPTEEGLIGFDQQLKVGERGSIISTIEERVQKAPVAT